jgi:hypothetical protein
MRRVVPTEYEAPEVEEIGAVTDLTGGNTPSETGDNLDFDVGTADDAVS